MTKKSFRTQNASNPRYPRLSDLRGGALRQWGLAAVGSLLLGGAGRAAGEMAAAPAYAQQTSGEAASGTGNPDAGAPKEPFRRGGKMPAPRLGVGGGKSVKLKNQETS